MISRRGAFSAVAIGLLLLVWTSSVAAAATEEASNRLQPIEWVLDTKEPPPNPRSKVISIAVHEMGCASGRNPLPHLEDPKVRYGKKAVVITLWIDPPDGAQLCPSNPVGRLKVKLPWRLGKRKLYDGADRPPRKVKYGEDPRYPGEPPPDYPRSALLRQ